MVITKIKMLPTSVKVTLLIVILVGASLGGWVAWVLVIDPFLLPPSTKVEEINSNSTIIKQGSFVRVDSIHFGSGVGKLAKLASGSYEVVFEGVAIAKGPSLFVYLSKKSTFSGSGDSPGEYVDLGPLPANEGTYSIAIPDTVQNVEDFQSILIWCAPFSVVFTFASLS